MIDLSQIRLVVFDFDGVFSDNRVWTNDRGEEVMARTFGQSHRTVDHLADLLSLDRTSGGR